jgi:transposase
MNAANAVIKKFGGARKVAEMLGCDPSRVYRWGYPPEKGGFDGLIPAKHQKRLLELAREQNIKLKPNDFWRGA